MLQSIGRSLRKQRHARRGSTVIPYALLFGLLAITAISSISRIGGQVVDLFEDVSQEMDMVNQLGQPTPQPSDTP